MILEKLKVGDWMSLLGLEIRNAWKPNGVVRHQGTKCQLSYLDASICMITLFSCVIRLSCWHQPPPPLACCCCCCCFQFLRQHIEQWEINSVWVLLFFSVHWLLTNPAVLLITSWTDAVDCTGTKSRQCILSTAGHLKEGMCASMREG